MSSMTDTVEVQRETYRRLVLRKRLILAGLVFLLLCSVLLDLALGPASYSLGEVIGALFSPDSASPQVRVVMWDIRLPVALMAVAVGAALSLAGAQMQTILNNPLASPFTLGISAAASFGAALGLAFGVALFPLAAQFMVPLNAFIMAMLSALLIHFLSMRRGVTAETIVLLGIALVFTFNALLALVQFCHRASRRRRGVLDHGQPDQSHLAKTWHHLPGDPHHPADFRPPRLGLDRPAPGR